MSWLGYNGGNRPFHLDVEDLVLHWIAGCEWMSSSEAMYLAILSYWRYSAGRGLNVLIGQQLLEGHSFDDIRKNSV